MADYSYIGSGKIYLKEIGAASGLIEVGNASALSFSVTEDAQELRDYTQPGGGTYNEVKRIESVEVSMTLHDLNPTNLSRALYGSVDAVTAGAVTDEAHVAYKGAYVPFNFLPAASPSWVLTKGATPLVLGTDYEVRPGGVYILESSTVVQDGDTIQVDYTKQAADVVQALTNAGKEYLMVFDGLNEARSGKRTRVRAYRVKIGAAQELGLIGEEYAALEVTGKLLKDTAITGAGLSQYVKVDIER